VDVIRRITLSHVKEKVAGRIWHAVCDKLLRIAIPMLAIIGWLIFGPRHRVSLSTVLLGLIWPVAGLSTS